MYLNMRDKCNILNNISGNLLSTKSVAQLNLTKLLLAGPTPLYWVDLFAALLHLFEDLRHTKSHQKLGILTHSYYDLRTLIGLK
jgi:hypothetical protein